MPDSLVEWTQENAQGAIERAMTDMKGTEK